MRPNIPGPRAFAAYVTRIRYSVYAIASLMAFAFLLGAVVAVAMPAETAKLLELVASEFAPYQSLKSLDLMVSLFLHNAFVCLLMAALGLGLGLVPLLIAFDNGLVLGIVAGAAAGEKGLLITLAAISPHGVIELPCMVLSAAIGLHLGYSVLQALFKRPVSLAAEVRDAGLVFLFWLLPLLLAAAFVESYVTTALVYYLLH
jgi:stage II sporulation protein M